MCIIVDTSVLGDFLNKTNPNAGLVLDWIYSGRGRLVFSKSLLAESKHGSRYMSLVEELKRQGMAVRASITFDDIDRCKGSCKSNDHPIVAIFMKHEINILFSNDAALISDFLNQNISGAHEKLVIQSEPIDRYAINRIYCPGTNWR